MAGARGSRRARRWVISEAVTEWVTSRAVMWRFWRGMSQRSVGSEIVPEWDWGF